MPNTEAPYVLALLFKMSDPTTLLYAIMLPVLPPVGSLIRAENDPERIGYRVLQHVFDVIPLFQFEMRESIEAKHAPGNALSRNVSIYVSEPEPFPLGPNR